MCVCKFYECFAVGLFSSSPPTSQKRDVGHLAAMDSCGTTSRPSEPGRGTHFQAVGWGPGFVVGLAAEFRQEVGGVDGLGEDFELVAALAGFFEQVGGGCLAGEQQNFAVGQLRLSCDGGLDAGHSSHDDIGDEHVGLEGIEGFDGFLAAVDGTCLKAGLVENDGERVGDYLFVVGYEYLAFDQCGGGRFRHAESPR